MKLCSECLEQVETVSAVVRNTYYGSICRSCLSRLDGDTALSSGAQSFDRRRQYEENAQDTVQPYDAGGNPRPEFYRLYPSQAAKTFSKQEIEDVKRQI